MGVGNQMGRGLWGSPAGDFSGLSSVILGGFYWPDSGTNVALAPLARDRNSHSG